MGVKCRDCEFESFCGDKVSIGAFEKCTKREFLMYQKYSTELLAYDLERLREFCNQRMTMREDVAQRMKLVGGIPMDRLRELIEAYKLIGKEVYFPKDKVYGVVKEIRTNGDFFWCYIYVGQGGFSLQVEYVKKFLVGEDKHEIFEPSRRNL